MTCVYGRVCQCGSMADGGGQETRPDQAAAGSGSMIRAFVRTFVPFFDTVVLIYLQKRLSVGRALFRIISTQTFRVAGLVILSTQKFGVLVLRK